MTGLWQSFTGAAPDLIRTMARHEVQTTLFIIFLLAVDSLLRRPSPRFRYFLWLVALAKALWPPFLSLPALDIWSRQTTVAETIAPIFAAPITLMIPVEPAVFTLTWGTLALAAWAAISLALVMLIVVNFIRFRLRLRPPHVEPYHYDESQSAVGQPWPPIWATDRIHSPLTVGLLRPRIYLTWKVIASGPKALRAILYHELAHILRRDGWITILQAAALVIHSFNPLVWLMNARLSRYREQLCDDFALRHTGVAPRDYGNMLLDQLSQVRPPLLALQTPTYFFETRRGLVHRLHQLMNRKGELMNRITSPQKALLAGLAFGLLLIASQCAEETVSLVPQAAVEESTERWLTRRTFPVPESTHVKVVLYDANAGEEVAVLFDGIPGKEYIRTELLPEDAEGFLLIPVGGYGLHFITSEGREEKGIIVAHGPSKIRTYPVDSFDEKFEAFATNATPEPDGNFQDISPSYGMRSGMVFGTEFHLSEPGEIVVTITDENDRHLLDLFKGQATGTEIRTFWDGGNPDGELLPTGIYYFKVETTKETLAATIYLNTTDGRKAVGSVAEHDGQWDTPPAPIGGYAQIAQRFQDEYRGDLPGEIQILTAETEIQASGAVGDIQVDIYPASALTPELEQAATEAVKQARWNPALKAGQPVAGTTWVPLLFGLENSIVRDTPPQPTAPTSEITGSPSVRFVRYDSLPEPIGGYEAIQQHVVYPEQAKAAWIQGIVLIEAFIDENGQVTGTEVRQSIPGLDEAAMEAIRQSTWEPAKQRDGKPVGVWVSVPVSFSLYEDITAELKWVPTVSPEFVPYDQRPVPIGGFAAIQQRVEYPEQARAAGAEGMVVVQVFVTEEGTLGEVMVLSNESGDLRLAEAAMAAVQNTAFKPAQQEGKPVGAWIAIPVNFALAGMNVRSLPYDEPPMPIGGFAAIMERVVYPEQAKAAGIEGTVIIQALVDEQGQVQRTVVLRGLPDTGLDKAAVEAIRNTAFKPAQQEGTPISAPISIPVNFRLAGTATENLQTEAVAPPPSPEAGPTVRFIAYDTRPAPIGGLEAIQQLVVYPEPAKSAGIEGTVIVQALVDENGQVQRTVVSEGIPDTGLDEAAMVAIKNTTFKPAQQKGKPVDGVWISIPVNFRLDD
ncbi:TonB family protein [Candidatus Neomarinimicrobiota bacterium]